MVHSPEKCPISRMQLWILQKMQYLVYYNGGSDGILDGNHGNCVRAGIIEMASKMRPLIDFVSLIFRKKLRRSVIFTTNFICKIFWGLGWGGNACRTQGMQALAELEQERRMKRAPGKARKPGVASNEMCTFLIMNISSLQLIPINVIAYRSQYGSVNPAAIVGAGSCGDNSEYAGRDGVL